MIKIFAVVLVGLVVIYFIAMLIFSVIFLRKKFEIEKEIDKNILKFFERRG